MFYNEKIFWSKCQYFANYNQKILYKKKIDNVFIKYIIYYYSFLDIKTQKFKQYFYNKKNQISFI